MQESERCKPTLFQVALFVRLLKAFRKRNGSAPIVEETTKNSTAVFMGPDTPARNVEMISAPPNLIIFAKRAEIQDKPRLKRI